MERVKQVLRDMIRMYIMDMPKNWEEYLHLVEISYNNGQQATLGMSPFKDLYGKKCRTLVNWDRLINRVTIGLDMLKEMEQRDKKYDRI